MGGRPLDNPKESGVGMGECTGKGTGVMQGCMTFSLVRKLVG